MNCSSLLHWVIIFLAAALLGFGGIAGTVMEGAKTIFFAITQTKKRPAGGPHMT